MHVSSTAGKNYVFGSELYNGKRKIRSPLFNHHWEIGDLYVLRKELISIR